MNYEKHDMTIIVYDSTDLLCAMSDGGSVVYPWSVNPNRSDS